jgi:hypothetical protein
MMSGARGDILAEPTPQLGVERVIDKLEGSPRTDLLEGMNR